MSREGGREVVGCILENLEKGLMTRSLVPSCAGREDMLLEKSVRIVINRPGVAGAVLQSPPSLINSLIH